MELSVLYYHLNKKHFSLTFLVIRDVCTKIRDNIEVEYNLESARNKTDKVFE